MEKEPLVSIVILNLNSSRVTSAAVESILASRYRNIEIIIVDNGSGDGSIGELAELSRSSSRIKLVLNSKNYGICVGFNIGLKKSAGEYVVFLSNDVLVDPDWLAELVSAIERDGMIAAVSSKVPTIGLESLMELYRKVKLLGPVGFPEVSRAEQPSLSFMASGGSAIYRRSVLERIGAFDEDFFAWAEDFDLGWRIWVTGYAVGYCPTSVVYHAGSLISGHPSLRAKKLFLVFRNSVMSMLKNYSLRHVVIYVPLRIFLEIPLTVGHVVRFHDPAYGAVRSRSIILAMLWIITHFSVVMSRRERVQRMRQREDDDIFRLMESFPRKIHWVSNRVMPCY